MTEAPTPAMRTRATERKKHAEHGVLHYLGVGVSAGVLLLVLLIGVLAVGIPALTGSSALTILTGSMEPKYPPGTLVVVTPIDPDDLEIGDVITYQLASGEPEVVTHRIVAMSVSSAGTTFTTQGDANPSPDPNPVQPVQVRGKLWYAIPYLGWVNTYITGDYRPWVVGGVVVLLVGYAVWMFVGGIREARRTRAAPGPSKGKGRHVS